MAAIAAAAYVAAQGAAISAGAAAAIAAAAAIIDLAVVAGIGAAQRKKAKDKARQAELQKDTTVRSAISPRQIIYGRARSSGPIVYGNDAITTGTSENHSLWLVVPLAGHEVDAIETVWLNGDEITAAQINWTTGAVTSGKYAGHVRLFRRLGTASQTVVSQLNSVLSGQWTSDHTGDGVAYLVAELILSNAAISAGVWDGGAPTNLRAVVKGKKVYDPRLDSTFSGDWGTGSGSHRLATPSTWEWSENPMLCLADYLYDSTLGASVPSTAIDYDLIAQGADICDASVDVPGGTESRYSCNGILLTSSPHADNVNGILSSMLGICPFVAGKFQPWPGAYRAPTETITADQIVGEVALEPVRPVEDRFNEVRAQFIDPDQQYQQSEASIVIDSTLRSGRDNGEVLVRQIALPMTNSDIRAQRIAMLMLQQNDQRHRLTIPTNMRGLIVATGDGVAVTLAELGYSAKTFRCFGMSFDPDKGISLQLREDSSAAWADPADTDYVSRSASTFSVTGFPVPAPTSISATAVAEGVRIDITQNIPPGILWDETIIYASASSAWSGVSEVGRTTGSTFLHQIAADTTRYYWARNYREPNTLSLRYPNSDTSTVTAASLGDNYLNDRVIVVEFPNGSVQSWRSDSSGNPPSGSPSVNFEASFVRDGTEVASQIITFALNSTTGNITATTSTHTGESVTVNTSGSGTTAVTVDVYHNNSGRYGRLIATFTDESAIASGGGGSGK